jgi:hypothetical protein
MPDSTSRPGSVAGRKIIEPFAYELNQLRIDDGMRLQRMVDLRQVMESFRRDSVSRILPSDYGRNGPELNDRTDVRLPYLLAICVKHAHRAGGQLPDVRVPRADSSPPERWRQSVLERFLACCWNDSDALVQLTTAAWDASCVGAGAFEVYWNVDRQVACFYARDPAGMVVVPDPYKVWPYQRAYRSWLTPLGSLRASYGGKFVDPVDQRLGRVQIDGLEPLGDQQGSLCQINEVKDETQCVRWSGEVLLHRSDHGADFCPTVLYPNVGPLRMVFGYSDVELAQDIALYYQRVFSRQADVAAFAARGSYTEEQTGVPAVQVREVIKKGGVIPIRRDGKVLPIEAHQQPSFINEHFQAARDALSDLSFVPDAAWGSQGEATSGSERGMQMLPQIELARQKQVNMRWALEKVSELCLRMAERNALGKQRYRGSMRRDGVSRSFRMDLGPAVPAPQGLDGVDMTLPRLIAKDYDTEIVFTDHLDVWDPQFVLSELNKFSQGAQSLQTTLERLGTADPIDEMNLIQAEAEAMPWLRQGMIALIEKQLDAQGGPGQGEGSAAPASYPPDQMGGGPQAGLESMMGPSGGSGSGTDALTQALNGSGSGRAPGAPAGQLGGGY